jgi:hypothetical protein
VRERRIARAENAVIAKVDVDLTVQQMPGRNAYLHGAPGHCDGRTGRVSRARCACRQFEHHENLVKAMVSGRKRAN